MRCFSRKDAKMQRRRVFLKEFLFVFFSFIPLRLCFFASLREKIQVR